MKFNLTIDIANDVSSDYAQWASEALREFLELFPEHKDKFGIQMRHGNVIRDCITGQEKNYNPTISAEMYNQANPEEKEKYIKQYDGSYLIPRESMEWYEQYATRSEGGINFSKISSERTHWINNRLRLSPPVRSFYLGVTNKDLYNNDGLFGYGISAPEQGSLVSTRNYGEDEFKRLVLHEFGHVFKAVHEDRQNITDTSYGEHCDVDGCIMRDCIYANLNDANKPNLFCDECITSMKQYLNALFRERTPENQIEVCDTPQDLSDNREANDDFKAPWREFAKKIAKNNKWEYEENDDKPNFHAKLKANDGASTIIEASSANNVALCAKDKDGNRKVPNMSVFDELVAKAQKDGKIINFGNIKSSEFKARLLLACMKNNPPMKTKNAPDLNDEFLTSIERATAAKLRIAFAHNKDSLKLNTKALPQTPKKQTMTPNRYNCR